MATHVLINRRARRLRDDGSPLLSTLRTAAARHGFPVHETFHPHELADLAHELVGAQTVAFAGGDGTYSAGLSALVDTGASLPALAFLPGGTVSTVARNWGMRGELRRYTERLLSGIADGHASRVERPSLRVNDGTTRVGFIWGAGLVARFFDAYDAQPGAGYGTAARLVGRIFVGSAFGGELATRVLTPVASEITIDGVRQANPSYSLMVTSVVRDLGLHMHVLYRAGEDPERLHFVASPLGPARLGPQMPLVLLGRPLLGHGHVDVLAREVRVRFEAQDAYVLDGDVHPAREVTLTPGPRFVLLGL